MTKIRVLVADDETGMRLVLTKLIAQNPAFVIAAEAEDGEQAVLLAAQEEPDVVFLDIDMPKRDGLSCAKEICTLHPDTAVIFVTAHDNFMSDAFELYAYDYLVKPFKSERLLKTLSRLEKTFGKEVSAPKRTVSEKLTIRNRDGILFLNAKDIIFIERNDRVSIITSTDGEYQTTESLNDLEERLDPDMFLRSHRSYLINTSRIKKATPYGRWTYSLEFTGTDRTALITHEKMDEIE